MDPHQTEDGDDDDDGNNDYAEVFIMQITFLTAEDTLLCSWVTGFISYLKIIFHS